MKMITITIKSVSLFALTLIVLALSACTGMMQQLGFEPIQNINPSSAQCADASVLITNLTANIANQQYQTPDGKICTGLINESRTES